MHDASGTCLSSLVACFNARFIRFISGARETRHFGPMTTVDVHLYTLNKHWFKFTNLAVSQQHQAKRGLTIISMVVNDYSHKPMKNTLAKEWFGFFGPYPSKAGWCGYNQWPSWRKDNRCLYHWRHHERLHHWYMAHDVWVPLSFILMLAQGDLWRRDQASGGRLESGV